MALKECHASLVWDANTIGTRLKDVVSFDPIIGIACDSVHRSRDIGYWHTRSVGPFRGRSTSFANGKLGMHLCES